MTEGEELKQNKMDNTMKISKDNENNNTTYVTDPADHRKDNETLQNVETTHGKTTLMTKAPAIVPQLTEENIRLIDGDSVLNFLHRFGKFQMYQLFLLTIVAITMSTAVLQGVFVGGEVTPTCRANISSESLGNMTLEEGECSWSLRDNSSRPLGVTGRPGGAQVEQGTCSEYTYGSDVPLSFISEWNLVCSDEALSALPQLMVMLGMMAGAALLPQFGDRFGRWRLIAACSLAHGAVNICLSLAPSFKVFLILKFLSGSLNQGMMVPYATMTIEAFTTELRLFLGFILTVHWTISVCSLVPFAYFMQEDSWRSLQLAYGIFSVVTFLPILFLSESCRWLLVNGKVKDTEKLLKKACKMNGKNYNDLLTAVIPQDEDVSDQHEDKEVSPSQDQVMIMSDKGQGQATMLDVMRNPTLRRMSLTIYYCWLIASLTYYGLTLLSTSLAGDPYLNFFIGGFVELPSAFFMWFIMQKLGRVRGIMVLFVGSVLSLLSATLVVTLADKSPSVATAQTALTLTGKFFISAAFNGLWIYTPEVYPTNLRNVGTGLSSTFARIGGCSSPFFKMLAKEALWAPGLLFSLGCLLAVALMAALPETGWRELPQTITEVESWFTEEGRRTARIKKSHKHAASKAI